MSRALRAKSPTRLWSAIENAQVIGNHGSPKTTRLYDRTGDQITLDEAEQTVI